MPECGLDEGGASKRVPLVSHTPHEKGASGERPGWGSYCSGAHSPAFLPMSGGGELHSTAEPISCRRAWQSMAVPEKSTFLGWAPTFLLLIGFLPWLWYEWT